MQVDGVLGSVDAVEGNSTHPTLIVSPPALPAGRWPVTVSWLALALLPPCSKTLRAGLKSGEQGCAGP